MGASAKASAPDQATDEQERLGLEGEMRNRNAFNRS